ncbi:uncharacterized protein LOC110733360 [Chenopodium quinoa]|uniref:uncharacterized protein LOC110733360 n=1 Tax=Chenopodium quinoa TaxID=63459 RepID=UPI000B76BD93|nr:uncharacterized protein LOC110733360 [Chenopodium quinoa]
MAKNSSSKSKSKSKSKQVGGSSSSSSASSSIADLFGPNPSSATSSSASLFNSVFGPPSMGGGRDSTHHVGNAKHGFPDNNGAPVSKAESSKYSYYQQKKVDQPCYYTSSIYYGGQDEVYSPTTRPGESLTNDPGVEEDPKSALRGNWWQGSAYY